ncbi:MAG: tyrosine-protein phosphatase [Pseudohongiella sp.]|uniref:tyrosine-protein phosphatase n=1 Tax=Pseudohongiella sp. TaxID=1979412 RepID=UPI0034A09B61
MLRQTSSFALYAALGATLLFMLAVSVNALAATPEQRALIERHLIPMEGGRNFRDLGGYQTEDGRQVKSGLLYRSGVLHHLTDADYKKIDALDIQTVVDFRAIEERQDEPTNWKAGDVNIMTWDYHMTFGEGNDVLGAFANPDLGGPEAEALMAELYRQMIDQQQPHYAAMFDQLANNDEALLFHCTAGKDRTGIAAALLLTALGVERETVIADYTLSETIASLPEYQTAAPALTDDMDETYSFLASMSPAALDALMGTRRAYIEAALDEMATRAGSVDAYIRNDLGVSEQDLQQLQATYLE